MPWKNLGNWLLIKITMQVLTASQMFDTDSTKEGGGVTVGFIVVVEPKNGWEYDLDKVPRRLYLLLNLYVVM